MLGSCYRLKSFYRKAIIEVKSLYLHATNDVSQNKMMKGRA